eukprot:SAG31_NODE_1123_length_9787_cov_5.258877_8_plen_92_part_00
MDILVAAALELQPPVPVLWSTGTGEPVNDARFEKCSRAGQDAAADRDLRPVAPAAAARTAGARSASLNCASNLKLRNFNLFGDFGDFDLSH